MSQVLYRKWRPRRWEEVVAQEHVVRTLQNAVAADRVAHAYLFSGPRGTGKTTTARLLAKAVNCLAPDLADRPCDACEHCEALQAGRFLDLIEIDAASNTSVEDVRDLRDKINFSPNQGRYKVYIIDEVHMLSTAAFNALLKTLEEPPGHAIFVLATTEVHKIPPTVLSRCQRHEFRRIPVDAIVREVERLVEEEGLDVAPEALTFLARQATGSLRDAISLLDQLAVGDERISLARAHEALGTAASERVLALVDSLLEGEAAEGLEGLQQALDGGADPRQFTRQVVDYLRQVLLIRMGNADRVDAPAEVRTRMAEHARRMEVPALLAVIRRFNQADLEALRAWQPNLPLELAFLECLDLLGESAPGVPRAESASPRGAEEPAERVEAAASEPQPAGGEGSEGSFAAVWEQVLQTVRGRNPQTQGLLNSCKPLGVENGVLVLGFASDLLKSKMENTEHQEITEAALKEILGNEVPIRCVVTAAARRGGRDLGGLDAEGIVAVALRDLGGEIVDVQ